MPGEPEAADIDRIPTLDVLDKPGFVYTDYMVDLPHDQTYLIENLLDPAHVSISHHGSQGNRKNAQPLGNRNHREFGSEDSWEVAGNTKPQ